MFLLVVQLDAVLGAPCFVMFVLHLEVLFSPVIPETLAPLLLLLVLQVALGLSLLESQWYGIVYHPGL